ncbi:sterol desaturase family protein [Cytophagaceae bacterium ABcell3]|nr:sterol desaturase family protein [Cytophagaceae bacterium ABcell3]
MKEAKENTPTLLHPYILSYLGPLSFFSISSLVFLIQHGFSLIQIGALFFSGLLIWTLLEYLITRYTLHTSKPGAIWSIVHHHIMHHKYPQEIKYISMPLSVIGIVFLTLFIIALLTFQIAGLAMVSGVAMGYFLYIIIHFLSHFNTLPENGLLKPILSSHFLHHAKYPHKSFGISTTLWDYVFGTLAPKEILYNPDPASVTVKEKSYQLVEVCDAETERAFLSVPKVIYQKDPNWIPPLASEIKAIFDPLKNPYFTHGDICRWILTDQQGVVSGRIAAFIDFNKMHEDGKTIGKIGFFECINKYEAAETLFNKATAWLQEHHQVKIIEGPANFGENDKFWGLLTEGYTPPSYGMNYNPPYYKDLFEKYGFKTAYNQLTNHLDLKNGLPERFKKIAERVNQNPRYTFRHFEYEHTDRYAKDFVNIYNEAWADFQNFSPMSETYLKNSLNEIKAVVEPSFIWFAYVDERPAALLVAMPDANEVLKYVKGNLNTIGKLKFLFYKKLKGFTCARVIIMGVIPQYQCLGLESALILNAYKAGERLPQYKSVQLAWVGDFNPKMIAIHKAMGAIADKKHATLRKHL